MDEQKTKEQENIDNSESSSGEVQSNTPVQSSVSEETVQENSNPVSPVVEPIETEEKKEVEKKSDFLGEEIEQPSIKETTVEKTEEVENVKPVIIEWKKPFFLMFGLGIAGIILMLILK